MEYLMLFLGLIILIIGGDFLVRGAVGLALKANISTLIIGMTVVSFGTSAPELLVSVGAALKGGEESLLSVGNVIGSNIANIALVLGITAFIFPVPVQKQSIRQDWPVMMGATILFVVFMAFFDGEKYLVNRWEGACLFVLIILFTCFLIWKSIKNSKKSAELVVAEDKELAASWGRPLFQNVFFLIGGCICLVIGADWLLGSAVSIATKFGVSNYMIGVTVVAFGTSIPELVTSAVAAYRKQTDIAIGNLIGSNIFNILCVVGITGSIAGMPLPKSVLAFDSWWMLGITFLILPLMAFGSKIHRWKGLLLISVYVMYMYFLISKA